MELEKVRDVYVFVCAALGTFALILTVYQAAHGKITSSAALGAAFVVCGLFVFIPQLKAFKVWGVEAELKETIDRAEEILGKLRQLSLIHLRNGGAYGSVSRRAEQFVQELFGEELKKIK